MHTNKHISTFKMCKHADKSPDMSTFRSPKDADTTRHKHDLCVYCDLFFTKLQNYFGSVSCQVDTPFSFQWRTGQDVSLPNGKCAPLSIRQFRWVDPLYFVATNICRSSLTMLGLCSEKQIQICGKEPITSIHKKVIQYKYNPECFMQIQIYLLQENC